MRIAALALATALLAIAPRGDGAAVAGSPGTGAGPAWSPGQHGKVARFEGRGEALDCGRDGSLSTPGGLTVAFRVRLDDARPGAALVRKPYSFEVVAGPAGSATSLELHAWPQGRACPARAGETVAVKVPPGSWHHVVLTYDSRGARLGAWLDGRQTAEGSLATACPERTSFRLAPTRYPLVLGGGREGFRGALDDVAVVARVLRPAEIAALAAGGDPPPRRLAGLWRFDDARGDGAPDASGNGNTCRRRPPDRAARLPRLGSPVDAPLLATGPLATAWLASANERVYQGDRPRAVTPSDVVAMALARNEVEAFQVVLRPRRALRAVHATLSDLTHGAHRWPAEAFTVRRVGLVAVDRPSELTVPYALAPSEALLLAQRGRAGLHPDPLVEGPFDAPANQAVALWVSGRAPADLPPGLYRGTLTLHAAGRDPQALPLAVRVWGFALPARLRANAVAAFDLGFGEGLEVDAVARDFAAHHVALATLPPPIVSFVGDDAVLDTRAFDRAATLALDQLGMRDLYFPVTGPYFLPRARDCASRKWQGRPICTAPGELAPGFRAALSSYVGRMAAHLAERGWLERFRFSVQDEPSAPADLAMVRQVAALVRQAAPGLAIAETHEPGPDLQGSVDTWLLGHFQPRRMGEALARGERLDWYPNLWPLIDRPATNTRVLGWVMWRYRLSGLLLWATQVAWRDLDRELAWRRPVRTTRTGAPLWGAGTFFYPDEAWRPLPSVRWELVRDTLEDYEYLGLLDDLCRELTAAPPPAEVDARRVRQACADLVSLPARLVTAVEADEELPRWRRLLWETEPRAFSEARERLGGHLEYLSALERGATTRTAPRPIGLPERPPPPDR